MVMKLIKIVKAFYLINDLDIILRYCIILPQVIAKTNLMHIMWFLPQNNKINIDSLID